jgi:hypothetical protein
LSAVCLNEREKGWPGWWPGLIMLEKATESGEMRRWWVVLVRISWASEIPVSRAAS